MVRSMKKKYINSALAILAASSIITMSASAERSRYTVDELKGLRNYIHDLEKDAYGQDVNGDGAVNIFDMVFMRKNIDLIGDFTESEFYASEKNVRYIGRNYYNDDIAWLVQSGSAIEFTVTGKSAELTLKGDASINNGADYRPRYAVIVDDEIISDSTMNEAFTTVKLFSSDTVKTSKVKVIHLSEANNGAVGVASIKVNSNFLTPISPTNPKKLQIEFIGDSITCAYGVEGASQNESFKTITENFMKSYAYLTAKKLDADYSAVSYSGHGIISGYTSDGKINTDSLVPAYYEQIGSYDEYSKPWDFTKRPNDVVVINLGTNDCTYVDKDIDVRGKEFAEGYTEFLKTVRKNNPDAYIICTLGTMGCNQLYPYIEQAIEDFKGETGDQRVSSYESATQLQSDGYGSDWHPSPVTQQKSAYVLADKICKAIGIESDEIGLDMAADAEYSLSTNSGSGANAWPYFSDYDRSFNINITDGGDDPSDVEAIVSPVKIQKDSKYRLTFNCTGVLDADIPIIIRNSNKTEVYFSGILEKSEDQSSFSEEFIVSSTDEYAELVLQIGGEGSRNITIRSLRLEKIE